MNELSSSRRGSGCGCGCLGIGSFGVGTVIAVVISWTTWHDVIWTIIHGFLSWAFILWFLIFYQ